MDRDVHSSKAIERPVTRWRRDHDEVPRPLTRSSRPSTGIVRPESKLERPISRRGMKDNPSDYGSSNFRASTPTLSANRVPTAGMRLSTVSSAGLNRLNTGLPIASQMGLNVLDRPVTQQGIAGVRPSTSRGLPLTRQVQDKRYYEGLLQLKIRELTQEINVIMRDIDLQNKEKATFMHYDKRAKDLATELTSLQGELADYNIVVDKMTSGVDKDTLEREVNELKQRNAQTITEIECMFEQRQQIEQKLRKMEKEIESERMKSDRLIESMDQESRQKYNNIQKEKTQLQTTIDEMQVELDNLVKEESRLEERMVLSPLKQEAVKLQLKIFETEEQRNKLREEEKNRLPPDLERQNLMQKIKQDNVDIAAAEAQISEKKKELLQVEQELEQLESDIEDTQSEKQVKYNELKKREEVMEQFMSTFEKNKLEELEKLQELERIIVQQLQNISNGLAVDTHLTPNEEITLLSDQMYYENYENNNYNKNFDELSKDFEKLARTLHKIEMLEKRLTSEFKEITEEIKNKESELTTFENLEEFKSKSEEKQAKLTEEFNVLKEQVPMKEKELLSVQENFKELKERLDKNKTYTQIEQLEKRLEKIREDKKKISNLISEHKLQIDYSPSKKQAFLLIKEYNRILKENSKNIY